MKLSLSVFLSILLMGCSSRIIFSDASPLVNAVINLPLEIAEDAEKRRFPECGFKKHPDEQALCREKKKRKADEMLETMQN